MRSMTGFGGAEKESGGHKIAIEMKSVNHRFLDVNVRTPRAMLFLEDAVRSRIKERLARGRVDVFVNYAQTGEGEKTVRVDKGLLHAYLQAAKEIEQETALTNDITLSTVLRIPDVLVFEEDRDDPEELKRLAIEALDEAIDKLTAAREAEGERIGSDMIERIGLLEGYVDSIAAREQSVVTEYREKLRARIADYLADSEIDENRFNAEVVYFADRCSITEELVRLKSHLTQCRQTLGSDAASGRSMDFIVQELNREFNTIGSKSSDIDITKLVLAAKSEVEKIREQVQNIE